MADPVAPFAGLGQKPKVTAATAVATNKVRVDFDEQMTNNANLLNAANYTITPINEIPDAPARTVTAVAASATIGPNAVTLTLDGDAPTPVTPGVNNYKVSVANTVIDLIGNTLDPANDEAEFSGLGLTFTFTPSEVERDGGYEVVAQRASGSALPDGKYFVYVNGVRCFSGVPGQGAIVLFSGETGSFITPPLAAGVYSVRILGVDVAFDVTVASALTFRKSNLKYSRYSFRRNLSPLYKTGPKSAEWEPPQ